MAEKYFAFLKDNRVMNIAVFASQDEELADRIAQEQGYDDALWLGETTPPDRWSTYNPTTKEFIRPTDEYLISIGILNPPIEEPTE